MRSPIKSLIHSSKQDMQGDSFRGEFAASGTELLLARSSTHPLPHATTGLPTHREPQEGTPSLKSSSGADLKETEHPSRCDSDANHHIPQSESVKWIEDGKEGERGVGNSHTQQLL